jgi:type II secretory pathway pseudopilin PulG
LPRAAFRLSPLTSQLSTSPGFTLIEALVSISIAAGLMLMLATIFRQASQVQRQVSAAARAGQVARTVFDQVGRDLMGLSREGLLMIRAQGMAGRFDERDHLILGFDSEGEPLMLDAARTDMLVMLTSGYLTSATNSDRVSNFARVIWSQTERIEGVDLDKNLGGQTDEAFLQAHPKFWGANQVLARHQTLCIPDPYSSTSSWASYLDDLPGGSWSAKSAYNNRGPDYFNMGIPDVVRYFDDAMIGCDKYGWEPISPFLFGTRWTSWSNELQPFRYAGKVFRIGRSGSNEAGTLGDATTPREGGGDLSSAMVDSEDQLAASDINYYYGYPLGIYDQTNGSFRGYERPRVYGPGDYHRIAAYGVASFQVDWSDGRRMPDGAGGRQWAFYPVDGCRVNNTNPRDGYSYNYLGGPGVAQTYAWGYFSPTTARESLVLKQGVGGVCLYDPDKTDFGPYVFYAWRLGQSGSFPYGVDAWPWPKALRIRIILVGLEGGATTSFVFERVFFLNIQ